MVTAIVIIITHGMSSVELKHKGISEMERDRRGRLPFEMLDHQKKKKKKDVFCCLQFSKYFWREIVQSQKSWELNIIGQSFQDPPN